MPIEGRRSKGLLAGQPKIRRLAGKIEDDAILADEHAKILGLDHVHTERHTVKMLDGIRLAGRPFGGIQLLGPDAVKAVALGVESRCLRHRGSSDRRPWRRPARNRDRSGRADRRLAAAARW